MGVVFRETIFKSGENAKLDYRESNIHYVKIGHQSALDFDPFPSVDKVPQLWIGGDNKVSVSGRHTDLVERRVVEGSRVMPAGW